MLDYCYVDEAGKRTPCAELPTALIQQLLRDGFDIDNDGEFRSEEDAKRVVRERLRLELFIRRQGLRT